jgi:amino acid transporter/nucleotide-binding universal stress UspA family protein
MASSDLSASGSGRGRLGRAARVLIISSITFTFISYWRTAAVVLCDLASTAYYIGGLVENVIGPAAPWFILAVMVFSYAVRSVYIESSSLFVRGGVYRVVKEALGGFLAKLSVSALMFDYILTGPTSGVSAGTYIMQLLLLFLKLSPLHNIYDTYHLGETDYGQPGEVVTRWGAVLICAAVTLYFFRQNLLGIHESSDKALKIMVATTIMAVVMFVWCGLTLVVQGGGVNPIFWPPDLQKKYQPAERTPGDYPDDLGERERQRLQQRDALLNDEEKTEGNTVNIQELDRKKAPGRLRPKVEDGDKVPRDNEALKKVGIEEQDDPLGLLGRFSFFDFLRGVGVLGLFIAFGHSILAMSGEETLAQVYREVESPKLKNFKRAAFIVFVYSVLLTAGISFLAVLLIPDEVRMKFYQNNLIGGLARHVLGPTVLKLFLETFVVVVGFLILSGAVNTAIIGSNGVLNRVAEDGVLADWFLRPHPRYGTTYRLLLLITLLQLGVIFFSRGDMVILGEAYAFGVVWSFVFKALAMVVLRFKDKTPREYKVPLNLKVGHTELPVGLMLIFLVLLVTALLNLFTKEVATVSGIGFTVVFLTLFLVSEHLHERKRQGARHQHLEQFNRQTTDKITPASLGLTKPYRKLVAIRSPQNLFMLEKTLAETDPQTTEVVVMTAKVIPRGDVKTVDPDLDTYDQQLMTAVVDRAERAGKEVHPLIVPTNNPLHAVLKTAQDLGAQELIMGVSNKYTADEQLEQTAFYWINLHGGNPTPLTVRILSRTRDVSLDLAGGNRIPKITERRARSVAELRAAGVGVDRVLLAHDGSPAGAELFEAVLTMLDAQVALDLVPLSGDGGAAGNGRGAAGEARERARLLGRELTVHDVDGGWAEAVVRLARENEDDLIILPLPAERPTAPERPWWDGSVQYVLDHAHCKVLLASPPLVPREVEE